MQSKGPLHFSKYSFAVPVNPNQWLLCSFLTGSVDIVDAAEIDEIRTRRRSDQWEGYAHSGYLQERGHLFGTEDDELRLYQQKHLEFIEKSEEIPIQLIFVPTYACNFRCDYCFQSSYDQDHRWADATILQSFFSFIDREFIAERTRPYITLFGGEPLLPGKKNRAFIAEFLHRCAASSYAVAIVTNGYELEGYLPLLKSSGAGIKEIQVTLDGSREVHDRRRIHRSARSTFDRISAGIDTALQDGFCINLRIIVDKDNIDSLPSLAQTIRERGWLRYPKERFKTAIGRNYDLHQCGNSHELFSRAELWREFTRMAREHPQLAALHAPYLHGMRTVKEQQSLPEPIYDACPGGKREFAFDLNGDIYPCTAAVGVARYRIGRFLQGEGFDHEALYRWKSRDITTIPSCRECDVSHACGGGCAVVAANATGDIGQPDCRPVKEILRLGAEYYQIGRPMDVSS